MATPRKRLSVKFALNDQLCDYREGLSELDDELAMNIWYQPEEFTQFRKEARLSCEEAIRKGLEPLIDTTYGHFNDRSQAALTLWSRCKDTRRGLERFVSQEYNRLRLTNRNKLIQAVLYTQQKLHVQGEKDPERVSSIIRNVSSLVSKESVQFALMLGRADERAVTIVREKRVPRKTKSLPYNVKSCRIRGFDDVIPTLPPRASTLSPIKSLSRSPIRSPKQRLARKEVPEAEAEQPHITLIRT